MSSARVATLDGLRGVAVLLVVFGHAIGAVSDEDRPLPGALSVVFNGGIGVTLFFVLSGFLITGLLVRERQRTDRVDYRAFYLRRTLRILPAYYVFLATMAILAVVDLVQVSGSQLLAAGLFVWNYAPAADGWWLGHTWSLAIEEQFYLLWPLALGFLRPRRACWVAVGYLVAAPVIRVGCYATFGSAREDVWMMFHARADSLLVGCLLALLPVAYPDLWQRLRWLGRRGATVAVAVVALLVSSALERQFEGRWVLPFGYTVATIAAGMLVLAAISRDEPTPYTRVLRWRALTLVGLISYSLYLWQQLFLAPQGTGLPGFDSSLLGVVAAFAAATLSYLVVERPFLRLKDRLQRTSGRLPGTGAAAVEPLPGRTPDDVSSDEAPPPGRPDDAVRGSRS
ncbi:acyltransferase family protein [Trujillonella endophytica]|uniref:Peptidoglycan/LPS O-acetylase OafA/YrhL, contains acyltransferase and SGNH-hydrolase domains n=1 Tax=Trujillonella endophytica TaxID=673521 RepID=A0A1H8W199_9ACTN|nr:acyltransferase [Trujillella endophytica]SEP21354.1 Peptidoglycan/LPS O-acetylase OafA/YrhL, contains acyltransferase and SGNH-hydrolase domains [Trujillella endophytica]